MIQAAGRIAAIGYEDGADLEEAITRASAEMIMPPPESKPSRESSNSKSAASGTSSPGPTGR